MDARRERERAASGRARERGEERDVGFTGCRNGEATGFMSQLAMKELSARAFAGYLPKFSV